MQQPVAARNHHVAVRGDELGVPQQHLAARPDREGRGKAFRFRRQRRKERAAVPAFGAHLFVGKPAETEFLEIEQQGVGVQHPGVVLIDAENAPLEDEERRNMAVAHVDHRNALALAALGDFRRGERAEDADREYQPGQYIRTQREARDARRSNEEERGRIRVLKMAAGAVLVLLFIYLLYPKLADVFLRARTAPATETQQVGEEEFNPYAPIRVVPNDYEE